MTKETTQLTKTQLIDQTVISVLGAEKISAFERAHLVSDAIVKLTGLLDAQYMKPIMALQGKKLGFLTDKDKSGGYPLDVVRNCLIEAVLIGLQPTGNHFNIIAGNMYPTKIGLGYLLNKYKKDGVQFEIVCGLPKINESKTSAAIDAKITWKMPNEEEETTILPIPLKMDAYASVDSLVGKATRKARAWLLSQIIGTEINDGEVEDAKPIIQNQSVKKEILAIDYSDAFVGCETIEDVDMVAMANPEIPKIEIEKVKKSLKK